MLSGERSFATLFVALTLAGVGASGHAAEAERDGVPAGASAALPGESPRASMATGEEIDALLRQAQDAMDRGQYINPARGSALGLYDRVLALDPQNVKARRGLELIAQYYLDLASAAARRRQLTKAQSMVDWARIVDADHPGIAAAQAQIRLLAEARRVRLPVERRQLRDRSDALVRSLAELGSRARQESCLAIIRSPSDASGRWMYQQMSQAPGDARIRADIEIGSPPMVELLCFEDDA